MAPNVMVSRSISTSVVRTILLLSAYIPSLRSHPLIGKRVATIYKHGDDDVEGDPSSPKFWIYMAVACTLVLFGGIFAGLTLGLMGQDEIYLQVIEQSGEEHEKKSAQKVLRLLKRGKHWVLVTLLLSNVITNETLPIILDRSLGGGWPAVLASTVLIVIFGEIIPQSVCVRYGLAIGASLSPFVLGLMYLMYPVAYPIALLLDKVLGEDHGTTYKKSGLKTLVTLHKTIGEHPAERLNQDEVTIISAVLDLKDKPVGSIMTPMGDVFTMDSETVLDEDTMDRILSEGYSRIPIHAPGEPTNFVGMLLVKILITYDPEDAMKVKDFPLATLPETAPETSCLDIVNFFQEGKSHMVLVSDSPGNNYGALGVLTLEDVIEELIGEEIIDESDVYIDVHKAIRRLNPSPIARRSKNAHLHGKDQMSDKVGNAAANVVASAVAQGEQENLIADGTLVVDADGSSRRQQSTDGNAQKDDKARGAMKRKLSGKGGLSQEMVQHLKHLGPSNRASAPRTTTSKNIKIKPGTSEDQVKKEMRDNNPSNNVSRQGTFSAGDDPYPSQAAHTMPDVHPSENGMSKASDASDKKDVNVSPRDRSPSDFFGTSKVRTGSVIERQTEVGGITKVVVETTASSEGDEDEEDGQKSDENKKKKGKKSKKNGITEEQGDEPDESTSLLGKKK